MLPAQEDDQSTCIVLLRASKFAQSREWHPHERAPVHPLEA